MLSPCYGRGANTSIADFFGNGPKYGPPRTAVLAMVGLGGAHAGGVVPLAAYHLPTMFADKHYWERYRRTQGICNRQDC